MQTKKQLRAQLEAADALIEKQADKIEHLTAEVERQHQQLDFLTGLTETHRLNDKLMRLGREAEQLLSEGRTMYRVEASVGTTC